MTNNRKKRDGRKRRAPRMRARCILLAIGEGEKAQRRWDRLFSRSSKIEDSPFTVIVTLSRSDPSWVDVGVYYSSRFAGGTTAEVSLPAAALFRAAEVAKELLPQDPRTRSGKPGVGAVQKSRATTSARGR